MRVSEDIHPVGVTVFAHYGNFGDTISTANAGLLVLGVTTTGVWAGFLKFHEFVSGVVVVRGRLHPIVERPRTRRE